MGAMLSLRVALSIDLPEPHRDRLDVVARARGETVQGLVGQLVEQFFQEEDRRPPALADVVRVLRAQARMLAGQGVTALWVFGSVARGDATRDSDVDLMAEFDSSLSLVGTAGLRADLSKMLGAPADLVERTALKPEIRATADRDAVCVL